MCFHGGLTLSGCPVPTKATLSLCHCHPQLREKCNERLGAQDNTRRDPSPPTVMGEADFTWEKMNLFITDHMTVG